MSICLPQRCKNGNLNNFFYFSTNPIHRARGVVLEFSVHLCGRGAEYCDEDVCVPVSVCEHISITTHPIFIKYFMHVTYGHGSDRFLRRCRALCTSSFMYDVIFEYNGQNR